MFLFHVVSEKNGREWIVVAESEAMAIGKVNDWLPLEEKGSSSISADKLEGTLVELSAVVKVNP